jgi:hypothetical protein
MARCYVRHATSGEVYAADYADDNLTITGLCGPLAEYDIAPDVDLDDYHYEVEDCDWAAEQVWRSL